MDSIMESREETEIAVVEVSNVVYAWLKTQFPDEGLKRKRMTLPADATFYSFTLTLGREYPDVAPRIDGSALYTVVKSHLDRSAPGRSGGSKLPTEEDLKSLEDAFTADFVGKAHKRLFHCIRKCWTRYTEQWARYRYPYIAIVQSSGFGKSRLLRECARLRHKINLENAANKRFHLLYVCARNIPSSTGFPLATTELWEFLFPSHKEQSTTEELVDQLKQRLIALFDYVMQAPAADVDEQLFRLFSRDPAAQRPFCKPPSGSPFKRIKDERHKVLIVAIDEARALLPVVADMKNIGWFRCFRHALFEANTLLRRSYGGCSGLFGIVVDTNSKVSDFAPFAQSDPSKRARTTRLFPPFVLTNTMDVFHTLGKKHNQRDLARGYKERVLAVLEKLAKDPHHSDRQQSWKDLEMLGLPLWKSRNLHHDDLVGLAADKLLNGLDSDLADSFNSAGLSGVASVMCRLGVRPYASTALASQAVADFMAVLSYVSADREQFYVSYSSDPILALGATKLWHTVAEGSSEMHLSVGSASSTREASNSREGTPDSAKKKRRVEDPCESNLSKYILPRLNVLLRQEVLDTGGVGEFAARIVLLLAMDACAVLETGNEDMRWKGAGGFYRVTTFLRALEGTSVKVHRRKKTAVKTLEDVRSSLHVKWANHFVSFTHFVQLSEEPTEMCIWGLLGRRAAAMLPRGNNGADFVIPICRPEDVTNAEPSVATRGMTAVDRSTTATRSPIMTMMLVQVKNHQNGCSSYLQAVTEKLDPSFVFSETNPFHRTKRDDVLRIYMSLRESGYPNHKYIEDTRVPSSFALGIFGLGPWSSLPLAGASEEVEVVSPAVASQLSKVLTPWWRVADKVQADMGRSSDQVESKETILSTAVTPLGDFLVLNTSE